MSSIYYTYSIACAHEAHEGGIGHGHGGLGGEDLVEATDVEGRVELVVEGEAAQGGEQVNHRLLHDAVRPLLNIKDDGRNKKYKFAF